MRYGMITHEELNETLAHMGSRRLARVRPTENDNNANEASLQAIRGALVVRHLVDCQQIYIPILLKNKTQH